MSLKLYNELPIKVNDVMFGYDDMVRAINSKSDKYFSKIAQLNYLARRVLYYYLKKINETEDNRYTTFYTQMTSDIKEAQNKTQVMINGSMVTRQAPIAELKRLTEKANSEIIEFSNFFKRGKIKPFRTEFLQALMVAHTRSGLSKLTDKNLIDALAQITNFNKEAKPGVAFTTGASLAPADDKKGNSGMMKGINPHKRGEAVVLSGALAGTAGYAVLNAATGGGDVTEFQTGGNPILQSEDYNLMIPMDIRDPKDGINDMIVRIHKIHLEQAFEGKTKQTDNETSVDIQVGDAIRFVYNDNIVHAIVCGFKPGKDLNEDGTDKRMEITEFRTEYMRISGTFESQDLTISPQQFLSLTNMRGIKFLPFKYKDENYSYAPYNSQQSVLNSKNNSVKSGLNGEFVFSCKDKKIPILPNGYKLPFISRATEGIKNLLSKLPFSTEVDIGNDSSLPQYSLPSYMTLEKVLVPPNFSEVIKLIKDFRGNNPDEIFGKMIKIMETSGLNNSNDCEKTSVKIAASDFTNRKRKYQDELKRVRDLFNSTYVKNGKIINRAGAIQYIKKLYNQQVDPGVFIDSNGNPMIISTKLVFAFDLIPSDPILSMNILLRALSQADVLSILERKKKLSQKILTYEEQHMNAAKDDDLLDNEGVRVQSGGEVGVEKAEKIITDTVDLLYKQNFIDQAKKELYVSKLQSAETTYDPNEKDTTDTPSTSVVKSGIGSKIGPGAGVGANFLSNLFKGSSGTSSSVRIGNDSCGNNTNIVCNGEDLVVTVTLKLNELISSCMNPDMIQHWGGTPGQPLSVSDAPASIASIVAPDASDASNAPPAAPPAALSSDAAPAALPAAPAALPAALPEAVPPEAAPPAALPVALPAVPVLQNAPPAALPSDAALQAVPPDAAPASIAVPPAVPPKAVPSSDAAVDTIDIDKLIAETKSSRVIVDNAVQLRTDIDKKMDEIVDTWVKSIMKNDKNIKVLDSLMDKNPITEDVIIDAINKVYGDDIKKELADMTPKLEQLLNDMRKDHEGKKKDIIAFNQNVKKIKEYLDYSPSEKTTQFYNEQNEHLKIKAVKILIDDTTGHSKDIRTYLNDKLPTELAVTIAMEILRLITSGDENYKKYSKLVNDIGGNVEKPPDIHAGGYDNNKTKNNKKSNKNKTKKRKGKNSSNRKFKFAKVKKI